MLQERKEVSPLLLSAPRGLGKTVLLRWLRQQATAARIRLVKISANQIRTLPDLVKLLAPEQVETAEVTHSGKASIWFAEGGASRTTTRTPVALAARLEQALLEQHRNKPLIITLDEAHILSPEVFRDLVNLDQNLVEQNCPVWTILAGTPGLESQLLTAEVAATFMERADSMSPALLTPEAAREALAVPLETHGWRVDESVMAPLLSDAQGFPFFLQLWGQAIWDAGVALGSLRLDKAALEKAGEAVNARRKQFYQGRYLELRKLPAYPELPQPARVMTKAARAVASLFQERQEAKLSTLMDTISPHLPDSMDPDPVFHSLVAKGFIWSPIDDRYVPGIPSLMEYVLAETAPAPAPEQTTPPPRP